MQIPQEIPYNPNRRVIVLLLVVAALAFGSGLLSVFPMRLSLSVSTLLVSMAALLVLRRLVWRRQLTVAETMITVPSGFLRLRPIHVPYEQVVSLWVQKSAASISETSSLMSLNRFIVLGSIIRSCSFEVNN